MFNLSFPKHRVLRALPYLAVLLFILFIFGSGVMKHAWNQYDSFVLCVIAATFGVFAYLLKTNRQYWFPGGIAGGLLLALVCEAISPYEWKSISLLGYAVVFVALSFALTIALLKKWAFPIWGAYLLLSLAIFALKFLYDLSPDPFVLSQIIGASPEDTRHFLSPGNISMFAIALAVCMGVSFAGCRYLAGGVSWNGCIPPLLLALNLYLVSDVHPSVRSAFKEYDANSPSAIYVLPTAYELAKVRNLAVTTKLDNLPSPAAVGTSIRTLHGSEGVVCILHIGESVKSERLSINGYHKETTPWLKQCPTLINFPDCTAASSATTESLPAILTNASGNIEADISPDLDATAGCVMDLFAANGFSCYAFFPTNEAERSTLWGSVYERMLGMLMKQAKKVYGFPEEGSLPIYQIKQIKSVLCEEKGNLFLVVNNIGSHMPFNGYDLDHPAFTPSDHRAFDMAGKSPEASEKVSNAYDNTVLHTDEYISRLVGELRGRPFIYIYVSDHGEPLGEAGKWMRRPQDYHRYRWSTVPLLVIYSPEFAALHPHFAQAVEQMKKNAAVPVAHQNVFHSLLGIIGIESPYYQAEHDISSPALQPYSGPHPSRNGEAADGKKWE